MSAPSVVYVSQKGGAYHARCLGKTASSTSSAEFAAARAAGKALGIRDDRMRLSPLSGHKVQAFYALPAATAPADYQSAEVLQDAEIRRSYGNAEAQRTPARGSQISTNSPERGAR